MGNDASKSREGPPRNFDATKLVIRRSASQKSDFAPQDVPTVSGQRSEGAISNKEVKPQVLKALLTTTYVLSVCQIGGPK